MTDATVPELRFSRVFDAPRELVFACMIDPDHLTHFWGPTGVSAPRERITVDPRPGGVFETVMVNDADGSEFPTHAIYDEVRAPERLVWTDPDSGMRVTSEFVGIGRRPYRGAHPPDQRARGHHVGRGPGRLPVLARPFRGLPGHAGPVGLGLVVAPGPDLNRPDPTGAIAEEYLALAELLASSSVEVWDAPSLCEGWRTREVVAHVTMPARYATAEFMAELEAAGGDFTRLSDVVAARDGALSVDRLLDDLRCPVLHAWRPPGGGTDAALTHCVIHALDVIEAVPLDRTIPEAHIRAVLDLLSTPGNPNPFGVELSGLRLEADDMDWSLGTGDIVSGAAQALVARAQRAHGAPRPVARPGCSPLQPGLNGSRSWWAIRAAAGRARRRARREPGAPPIRWRRAGRPERDAAQFRPGGPTR